MAFALWIDGELAWAQGLHEYRPMGVAVVALTDRFRPRDFDAARPAPARSEKSFVGLFASLGELNHQLARSRRKRKRATPAWI